MERKTETRKDATPAYDPFAALKPLAPAAWLGTAWLENLSNMSSEISSFVADRIKEDVKTQHALLHCKSLVEMQHVQAEFLQKAFDQYQAETGKLVAMTGKMAVETPPNGKARD